MQVYRVVTNSIERPGEDWATRGLLMNDRGRDWPTRPEALPVGDEPTPPNG
jgi:hypothetical protein